MSTKKIETLVLLLICSLAIQWLGSKAVFFYITNASETTASGGMQIHAFANALEYQKFTTDFLALLVNLVIGYWLYTTASARKLLWALLGVCAKWWALPLFAYYLYTQSNERT